MKAPKAPRVEELYLGDDFFMFEPGYRILLGERMPVSESTTDQPPKVEITGTVGYVDYSFGKRYLPEGVWNVVVMQNLGVEAIHQGEGHARQLIDLVETLAKEQGHPAVYTSIATDQGLGLLTHIGYEQVDTRRFRKLL